MKINVIILLALLLATGCSTIYEGRTQTVQINTNPSKASCDVKRMGEVIASVQSTPSSVLVEKSKYDVTIVCNKNGYEEATYIDHSGTAGATWGNIIAGGFIGWGVDSATGADNKYESPVNITLNKK